MAGSVGVLTSATRSGLSASCPQPPLVIRGERGEEETAASYPLAVVFVVGTGGSRRLGLGSMHEGRRCHPPSLESRAAAIWRLHGLQISEPDQSGSRLLQPLFLPAQREDESVRACEVSPRRTVRSQIDQQQQSVWVGRNHALRFRVRDPRSRFLPSVRSRTPG